MKRQALTALVVALLGATVWSAGCATGTSAPATTSSPSASSSAPASPGAVTRETPAHAARRLFPNAYRVTLSVTEHPNVLRGAVVGRPRPVSRDYCWPGDIPASWALPADALRLTPGLFAAMRLTPWSEDAYIVPMMKGDRSVCEFEIERNDKGRWSEGAMLSDPLPGGLVHDSEAATAKLRKALGSAAAVRIAVLLPSGLVFAVGDNRGAEAAVYLTFINDGPGITSFDKYLPRTGRLFTPDQLARLLKP